MNENREIIITMDLAEGMQKKLFGLKSQVKLTKGLDHTIRVVKQVKNFKD